LKILSRLFLGYSLKKDPLWFTLSFLLVWVLSVIILFENHEIWRDEADAWLMARDLPYENWISFSRHSGHPLFFYLILSLFAKQGFPSVTLLYVNLLISLFTGFLVFRFSPLPILLRSFIPFSVLFLYEFPVIARNYSMGVCFVFLFLLFYKNQKTSFKILGWFFLFLATQVHVLFFLLASGFGILSLESLLKKSRKTLIDLIPVILLSLAIPLILIQIWPPQDAQMDWSGSNERWIRSSITTQYLLFPSLVPWAKTTLATCIGLLILFGGFWMEKDYIMVVAFGLFLLCFFLFFHFVYASGIRHVGIEWVGILAYYWMGQIRKKNYSHNQSHFSTFSVVILLISTLSYTYYFFQHSIQDLYYPFSGSKEVSTFFLSEPTKKDRPFKIAGHYPDSAKTVLFYLSSDTRMIFPALGREGSHMFWDRAMRESGNKMYKWEEWEEIWKPDYYLFSIDSLKLILYQNQPMSDTNFPKNFIPIQPNNSSFYLDPTEKFIIFKRIN
jgi:hypothetical protein